MEKKIIVVSEKDMEFAFVYSLVEFYGQNCNGNSTIFWITWSQTKEHVLRYLCIKEKRDSARGLYHEKREEGQPGIQKSFWPMIRNFLNFCWKFLGDLKNESSF